MLAFPDIAALFSVLFHLKYAAQRLISDFFVFCSRNLALAARATGVSSALSVAPRLAQRFALDATFRGAIDVCSTPANATFLALFMTMACQSNEFIASFVVLVSGKFETASFANARVFPSRSPVCALQRCSRRLRVLWQSKNDVSLRQQQLVRRVSIVRCSFSAEKVCMCLRSFHACMQTRKLPTAPFATADRVVVSELAISGNGTALFSIVFGFVIFLLIVDVVNMLVVQLFGIL